MFAPRIECLWGWAIECQQHSTAPLPRQRNITQNRLQLVLYTRYLGGPCALRGIFKIKVSNDVSQILRGATWLSWQQNLSQDRL